MKRLLCILLVLSMLCGVEACKKPETPTPAPVVETYGSLQGFVTNSFGQAIEGALVQTQTASATTNVSGSYVFQKILAKSQNITVSKTGFVNKIQTISIQENVITKLDFSLASGDPYLTLSDSVFKTTAQLVNLASVKISSNSSWIVKNSSWISVQKDKGEGNDVLIITCAENTTAASRKDSIQITSGKIKRIIRIEQGGIITLNTFNGVLGNDQLSIPDSIYMHFNKPITGITIKSNFDGCISEMNYKYLNNNKDVVFSYPCAAYGRDYSFTISATDDFGTKFSKNITVSFYKNKFDINGFVTDYLLVNNESELLISTFNPSTIVRYSIQKGTVLQTYNLSQTIAPLKMVYNNYNSKVYIMGAHPDIQASGENWNYTQPYLYTLNLQTSQIVKAVTFAPDALDQRQVPFDIGFTASGHGIVLLQSLGSSAVSWKLIDCTNNNAISSYPNNDFTYVFDIEENYNNSKLVLSSLYNSRYVYDDNTGKVSEMKQPFTEENKVIVGNRKNNQFYFAQQNYQAVVDLSAPGTVYGPTKIRIPLGELSADFSYKSGGNRVIYVADADGLRIIDYNTLTTLMSTQTIYMLRKLKNTSDGKLSIAYKYDYPASTFYLIESSELYRHIK